MNIEHVTDPNVSLAHLHLETALKLTSIEYVTGWLKTATTTPTPVSASSSPTIASKRGRKPGAAAPDTRCIWTMTTGDQCKNKRSGTSEYCKIHISKTHIIAPTPQ
jgi:hypothetical protein